MNIDRCKECGANLAMVGIRHRCVPLPKGGLRVPSLKTSGPIGDGVALKSMAHPLGLIEKMADAIRFGKLGLKPGRPKITEPRPWETAGISRRTYYRRLDAFRQAQKEQKAK